MNPPHRYQFDNTTAEPNVIQLIALDVKVLLHNINSTIQFQFKLIKYYGLNQISCLCVFFIGYLYKPILLKTIRNNIFEEMCKPQVVPQPLIIEPQSP